MNAKRPKVIIAGALGKMGSAAVKTFLENSDKFQLAGILLREVNDTSIQAIESLINSTKSLSDSPKLASDEEINAIQKSTKLEELIKSTNADILVELTTPHSVFQNSITALKHGLRPVIGATGLSEKEIKELSEISSKNKIGAIIAPNFAIGAILMMQFAQKAVKYFDKYEIIEFHHDKKLDSPSGTAIKTAQLMQEASNKQSSLSNEEDASRGLQDYGVPIHSVRLQGLVAHQEVIFGGVGQTLTIRHDTIDRSSFMPGILLCCEEIMQLEKLVYGLENLI